MALSSCHRGRVSTTPSFLLRPPPLPRQRLSHEHGDGTGEKPRRQWVPRSPGRILEQSDAEALRVHAPAKEEVRDAKFVDRLWYQTCCSMSLPHAPNSNSSSSSSNSGMHTSRRRCGKRTAGEHLCGTAKRKKSRRRERHPPRLELEH